jgi:hypothetical protein
MKHLIPLLLLVGCAGGSPIEVELIQDPEPAPDLMLRVPAELIDELMEPAARWEAATGLDIEFVAEGGVEVISVPYAQLAKDYCDPGQYGCASATLNPDTYEITPFRIAVGSDWAQPLRELVWAHEIGHLFLAHLAEAAHTVPGLMNDWWSGYITTETLVAVCDKHDCPWMEPEQAPMPASATPWCCEFITTGERLCDLAGPRDIKARGLYDEPVICHANF